MGANFSSATLDDVTMALIQRKTKMKPSEITDWFNELKVSNRVHVPEQGCQLPSLLLLDSLSKREDDEKRHAEMLQRPEHV